MDIVGIDIGGTKCSITLADSAGCFRQKQHFLTTDCKSTLNEIFKKIESILNTREEAHSNIIFGISCGGPLDEPAGLILSPPNLPGWDNININNEITSRFGGKAFLMNDANAGALAEWKFGAAKNCQNVIFLTYGTGMGAGLILNNQLYSGACGMAGEVGHVRLAPTGPVGYGKAGSFEGLCSGGGIAQMGKEAAGKLDGKAPFNKQGIESISAKDIAEAARAGDGTAIEILQYSAKCAGMGLAVLIDILNPDVIVLGSFYSRCRDLLESGILDVVHKEALPQSVKACRIVPSGLGEQIGDYAAISIPIYYSENKHTLKR